MCRWPSCLHLLRRNYASHLPWSAEKSTASSPLLTSLQQNHPALCTRFGPVNSDYELTSRKIWCQHFQLKKNPCHDICSMLTPYTDEAKCIHGNERYFGCQKMSFRHHIKQQTKRFNQWAITCKKYSSNWQCHEFLNVVFASFILCMHIQSFPISQAVLHCLACMPWQSRCEWISHSAGWMVYKFIASQSKVWESDVDSILSRASKQGVAV